MGNTIFRWAPHYEGKKFYHGYTTISDIKKITTTSLYPRHYKVDWTVQRTYLIEDKIVKLVDEIKNVYYPEIYSNKKGHIATLVDNFKEGDLVMYVGYDLSHYEAHKTISRVVKIYGKKQRNSSGLYYTVEVENLYDNEIQYILHKDELLGLVEVEPDYFKNWLKPGNHIDIKHSFK